MTVVWRFFVEAGDGRMIVHLISTPHGINGLEMSRSTASSCVHVCILPGVENGSVMIALLNDHTCVKRV